MNTSPGTYVGAYPGIWQDRGYRVLMAIGVWRIEEGGYYREGWWCWPRERGLPTVSWWMLLRWIWWGPIAFWTRLPEPDLSGFMGPLQVSHFSVRENPHYREGL